VAELVDDPGFAERLAPLLADGLADGDGLRRRVDQLGQDVLDGIALGSRSAANRLIDEIAELTLARQG
jgi:hypothetical protein